MYEAGLTARKVAVFDNAIFDKYREWEADWNWEPAESPTRYLRVDKTFLLYLPVLPARRASPGFSRLMKMYPRGIFTMWDTILKPVCNHLASLTGIEDPVIVQADIARMPPLVGDTVMHTDTRINQRYARRYNVAISTNNNCWLYHNSYDLNNGGTRDHIEPGELWEINNKIIHTAVNYGETWRTHLIIDVMPRHYATRMFELYDPYDKVPNPQGLNTTYDYDLDGKLIDQQPLFNDLPHCFPARTHT